jgi:cytochrome b561
VVVLLVVLSTLAGSKSRPSVNPGLLFVFTPLLQSMLCGVLLFSYHTLRGIFSWCSTTPVIVLSIESMPWVALVASHGCCVALFLVVLLSTLIVDSSCSSATGAPSSTVVISMSEHPTPSSPAPEQLTDSHGALLEIAHRSMHLHHLLAVDSHCQPSLLSIPGASSSLCTGVTDSLWCRLVVSTLACHRHPCRSFLPKRTAPSLAPE